VVAAHRVPVLRVPTLAESRSIYLPPWRVDVTVRPGVPRLLPLAELARTVARALDAAGAPRPAALGLILADDRELAGLNAEHMGVDGPTDVLSFPLLPPEAFAAHPGGGRRSGGSAGSPAGLVAFPLPPGVRTHLGDVVVSVERAVDQAARGRGGWTGDVRWAPADELRLLVTHGVLHVCGWDHAEPAEEAAMRGLEGRLLRADPATITTGPGGETRG
jgi:probable rRNA maturation factor